MLLPDFNRFDNVYLTSDTHFNHFNIIKYCSRPFSLKEAQDATLSENRKREITNQMNQTLIKNWNDVVLHEDLVIHLGDFSFGHPKMVFNQLNGHIFLIRGNHDDRYYKWFPNKSKYLEMKIGRFNVLLKHVPLRYVAGNLKDLHSFDLEKYDFCICGHVHEKWLWNGINYNVGVDVHGFNPISLKYIGFQLEERVAAKR